MLHVVHSSICTLDLLHMKLGLNTRQCGWVLVLLKQPVHTVSGRLVVPSPMKLGSIGQHIKLLWAPLHTVQLCGSVSSTMAVLMVTWGTLDGTGVWVIMLIS